MLSHAALLSRVFLSEFETMELFLMVNRFRSDILKRVFFTSVLFSVLAFEVEMISEIKPKEKVTRTII